MKVRTGSQKCRTERYGLLDTLRGINFCSMFLYHAIWDLVYLYGIKIEWYLTKQAYIWQQSICWTFIVLSGFCWSMGRKKEQRGLTVFLGGVLVTLVTMFVMPGNAAVFGVLTLLGSCSLLWIWPEKLFCKVPPVIGMIGSFSLFILFRDINTGWLGFEGVRLLKLPDSLYRNLFTAYLGFPAADFSSTDYFSLIPWFFLFVTGYYLYRLMERRSWLFVLKGKNLSVFSRIGRHSLLLYLLHQPVLYVVFTLIFTVFKMD